MAEGGAGGAGGAGGGDAGGAGEKAPGRKGDIGDGVDLDQILPVNVGRLKMYEVGKQIGSGKFSVVFRARTRGVDGKQENVHVALKKINIFDMMDAKSRNKCLREVRMLQSISQHDNLIAYLDAFIEDNELMIVFEWAENGDLRRLLRKTTAPFEERQVWNLFLQVAGAIAHMHEQRMMHRDIKPANIFIAGNNVLKLGDLGLGRVFSNESVEAFSKVGTPLYMSPEVLHGQGYDFKSDVWSLGCLLYELATLKSPFEAPGQTLYDIFRRINSGEFPPLPDIFSAELRSLVSRMLHKDPKHRPTAEQAYEMAQAACSALQDRPSGQMMMVRIVDGCKLLGYEGAVALPNGLPLLDPCFFSMSENGTPRSSTSGKVDKFVYLRRLVEWLLKLSGVDVKEKAGVVSVDGRAVSDEDVAGGAAVLVEACKALGVGGDVAAVRLKTGTGEAVVGLLDAMVEHVLRKDNVRLKPPAFASADENDEDIEDMTPDGDDEDAEWWKAGGKGGDSDAEEDTQAGAREAVSEGLTEEAIKALRAEMAGALEQAGTGWRARVDARAEEAAAHARGGAFAGAGLSKVRARAVEDLEAISARERILEEWAKQGGARDELLAASSALEKVTEEHSSAKEAFLDAKRRHDEIAEKLEAEKEGLETRERELQDGSGLARIRQAIKTIKADIRSLDLRAGVATHALRLSQAARAEARRGGWGARRRRASPDGSAAGNSDDSES